MRRNRAGLYQAALAALFAAISFAEANAQVNIVNSSSDGNALRDAILGGGITPVGNATLVNGANSAGFFSNAASVIGINSGIVLSTGSIFGAEGPNSADGFGSEDASAIGDADLNALVAPNLTTDTTSLEFQFTTTGGDVFFNFVFASEEYNEYADSPYNDVFAFFLNDVNIALIPGTSTPVSISTVNGGEPGSMVPPANPQYFNNNDPSDGGLFLNNFGYDGFTDVFTAAGLGLGAGTHTIKLAISDVTDSSLDSAVFLEALSFQDDSPANASFDSIVDSDTYLIDFGNVALGTPSFSVAGSLTNLQATAATVSLQLVSVNGMGDTTVLTTDLAPFAALAPGASSPFQATISDTSQFGEYTAIYELNFTDILGSNQILTLTLKANVIPEPASALLLAALLIGLCGFARLRLAR
jgi:hypothetical protein